MRDNENSKCPRQPLVLVCGLKRAWTYQVRRGAVGFRCLSDSNV